ncbi:MAG: hypothetical protein KF758_19300 [Anaerolineales bacterium]|nr:hypothetical protein [Anaerolineales bacterium]
MTVRVGNITFSDWVSLSYKNGWSDTFIFRINALSGIPPFNYKPLLQRTTSQLNLKRPGASLWIQVDSPGEWYIAELKRSLRFGLKVPFTISHNGNPPGWLDFSRPLKLWHTPSPHPPLVQESIPLITEEELKCLQVLARIKKATELEVASLAGLSDNEIIHHLNNLKKKKLVIYENNPNKLKQKYLFSQWRATRNGLSIALRSWGIPKGIEFGTRKEENSHLIGTKHRHISRRWMAWLKQAWPHAEVWTGWSEVRLRGMSVYPDALAWGRIQGYESLFWLEVGDEHKSREQIVNVTKKRLDDAWRYCQYTGIRLIYAQLSVDWVQDAVRWGVEKMPPDVAVVIGNIQRFGDLSNAEWGTWSTI